jgi:hypothetical protein
MELCVPTDDTAQRELAGDETVQASVRSACIRMEGTSFSLKCILSIAKIVKQIKKISVYIS